MTTATATTKSSHGHEENDINNSCTVHRVKLAATAQEEDDWITEKSLTPSAAYRLGKKQRSSLLLQNKNTKKTAATTTEEHFSTSDTSKIGFYGAYAKVRQQLDYSYHVHYRKERQWLHDAIIEDNLLKHQQLSDADCDTVLRDYHQGTPVLLPRHPWLIFLVGVHGAAKHSTVRHLLDHQRLRLLSLVCVDTDDLRRYLPEYATYRKACPQSVDRRTRKEAGYISECLTIAALQAGRNVIFYGNLKDVDWYKHTWIPFCREQFHGNIKVALIQVTADVDQAFARAQQRAIATGRTLSFQDFEHELKLRIPQACQQLKPIVECYAEICNHHKSIHQSANQNHNINPVFTPSSTPKQDELELLTDGGDWNQFTKTFDQRASILSQSYPDPMAMMQKIPTPVVHAHHRRVSSIRRISAVASSEENHTTDDMEFYGPFAAIRQRMDYTYHKNYTFERQHFQDAIVREFLQEAGEEGLPTRPWAVFTAGAMGAGKGYAIDSLIRQGRFPLLGGFVKVNSDAIRRYLPEYHLYIETNPDLAGDLTNKEAGYIAEILALAGLSSGKNILVDGSLRCASWYRKYFKQLRSEFPGLRLAIIHVTAPTEAIFKRAAKRALETGRVVPQDVIAESIEEVPKSVAALAPLVDYQIELSNDPDKAGIEIVTPGATWEQFTAQWVQEVEIDFQAY